MRRLLPIFLLILLPPAAAQVYKCRLPSGQTEITNKPCQGSTVIEVRPEEKVSEAERRATERELQRARAFLERREAELRAQQRKSGPASAPATPAVPAAVVEAPPRPNPTAADCLRDLSALALDPEQRNRLESDCRRLPGAAPGAPAAAEAPAPLPAGARKEVEPLIPRLLDEPARD